MTEFTPGPLPATVGSRHWRDTVKCEICDKRIPAERLEALPETKKCVGCASKFPDPLWHDPEVVCAKSSPSGQNGWSGKS